jgi:hypothetical protein
MLAAGIFRSVVVATSTTPDPNTTNNISANGLVVRRPASIAVGVQAPALARVGSRSPIGWWRAAPGATGRGRCASVTARPRAC